MLSVSAAGHLAVALGSSVLIHDLSSDTVVKFCSASSSSSSSVPSAAATIRAIAFDPSCAYFATAGDDKKLRVYRVKSAPSSLSSSFSPSSVSASASASSSSSSSSSSLAFAVDEIGHGLTFAKKLTTVRFALHGDEESIVVADRVGDVYRLSLKEFTDMATSPGSTATFDVLESHIAFGHFVLVTDLTVVPGDKKAGGDLIITADQEGKIRTSNFPFCNVIHSIALTGQFFISAALPIASASSRFPLVIAASCGDKEGATLSLWCAETGTKKQIIRMFAEEAKEDSAASAAPAPSSSSSCSPSSSSASASVSSSSSSSSSSSFAADSHLRPSLQRMTKAPVVINPAAYVECMVYDAQMNVLFCTLNGIQRLYAFVYDTKSCTFMCPKEAGGPTKEITPQTSGSFYALTASPISMALSPSPAGDRHSRRLYLLQASGDIHTLSFTPTALSCHAITTVSWASTKEEGHKMLLAEAQQLGAALTAQDKTTVLFELAERVQHWKRNKVVLTNNREERTKTRKQAAKARKEKRKRAKTEGNGGASRGKDGQDENNDEDEENDDGDDDEEEEGGDEQEE